MNRGLALHEEIVCDQIIAAPAELHGAAGAVKNIAVDFIATGEIIEVNGRDAVQARAFEIVPVIVANHIALPGEIAARVNRPRITGLGADAIDFIIFQQVIVTALIDGFEGGIMN